MAELHIEGGRRRVDGTPGELVDADVLLHRSPGPIPTLGIDVAEAEAAVRTRAARSIATVGEVARVAVVGDGVLADMTRRLLGGRTHELDGAVAAIDTTGEPHVLLNIAAKKP